MLGRTKTFRRVLTAAIAAAALLASLLAINNTDSKRAYAAIGGSGTSGDPYTIGTAADLADFATRVNNGTYGRLYFKLTDDIELSGSWTPIGTSGWPFRGYFDGGGHKITGLYINSSSNNQGLFGYIGNGIVHHLGIEDANITAVSYIGGLAGRINGGTVMNCYVTGSISGGGTMGGIVGETEGNADISSCYFKGSVGGNGSSIGGLAGYPSASTIKNCYTVCSVSGNSGVGGISGNALDNPSTLTIENCYAAGPVSGSSNAGGLTGHIYYNNAALKNSVALNPSVSATTDFGRVAGSNLGTLSNNYALAEIKNKSGDTTWNYKGLSNLDGADLTAEEAAEASFWENTMLWDTNVWDIGDGRLPILKDVGGPQDGELPQEFRTSLSPADVTVTPDSYTYTGSLIMPASVTVVLGGKTLTEGMDYTLSITSADGAGISAGVKVGIVTLTVTGIGLYKDTAAQTYTIVFKTSFIVNITHSLSGMSATVLIVWSESVLPNPGFKKEGYIFTGLYTDAEMTQPYDPDAAVTGDMNLYAKWEKTPDTAAGSENTFLIAALSLAAAAAAFMVASGYPYAARSKKKPITKPGGRKNDGK